MGRLARKRPSPLARGQARIWAGGSIYAVGSINFLFYRSADPHLTAARLGELTGIPKTTLANKAKLIRDTLRIDPFDAGLLRRRARLRGWSG